MNGEKIDGKIEIFRRSNKIDCTNCCGWQQFNHNWMLHLICASLSLSGSPCTVQPMSSAPSTLLKLIWARVRTMQRKPRIMFRFTEAYRKFKCGKNQFPYTFFSALQWFCCVLLLSGVLSPVQLPPLHYSPSPFCPSSPPGEEHFVKWRQSDLYAFISHTNFGTHKRSKQQKKNIEEYNKSIYAISFSKVLITSTHLHPFFLQMKSLFLRQAIFISSLHETFLNKNGEKLLLSLSSQHACISNSMQLWVTWVFVCHIQ